MALGIRGIILFYSETQDSCHSAHRWPCLEEKLGLWALSKVCIQEAGEMVKARLHRDSGGSLSPRALGLVWGQASGHIQRKVGRRSCPGPGLGAGGACGLTPDLPCCLEPSRKGWPGGARARLARVERKCPPTGARSQQLPQASRPLVTEGNGCDQLSTSANFQLLPSCGT